MGSQFFKTKAPSRINASGTNLAARAFGAPSYSSHAASIGAQKDVAAASAISKAGAPKQQTGSAAYPKGPKI